MWPEGYWTYQCKHITRSASQAPSQIGLATLVEPGHCYNCGKKGQEAYDCNDSRKKYGFPSKYPCKVYKQTGHTAWYDKSGKVVQDCPVVPQIPYWKEKGYNAEEALQGPSCYGCKQDGHWSSRCLELEGTDKRWSQFGCSRGCGREVRHKYWYEGNQAKTDCPRDGGEGPSKRNKGPGGFR